ncbi:hypothetical protein BGZ63DRAFT_388052 [Mariannaea sp. PMI_226]|nr:hypothetical protein BGZ63DRAFT_388052 [Mariannaea sp. PMI_226]
MDPDPFRVKAIGQGIDTIGTIYETIATFTGLPKVFSEVTKHLTLVKNELETAQLKLELVVSGQYQSVSTITNLCSRDVERLKDIFQVLKSRCKREQDWATIRPFYVEAIERNRDRRIECLVKQILGNVKKLCLHDALKMPVVKIDAALTELAEAGPSLDDSEFNQVPNINTQTVQSGGFGQQNNPTGGINTFSSGYNIHGGTANFGQPATPLEGQDKT